MKWPFGKKTEDRSAISFSGNASTDAVSVLEAQAAGSSITAAVAAVEVAAGYWQRGFQTATASAMADVLTPSVLGYIGRNLCMVGQSVLEIDLDDSGLRLLTPDSYEITAVSYHPSDWRYNLKYNVADGECIIHERSADSVVNIRYAADHRRPGYGKGPLQFAGLTRDVLQVLEYAIKHAAIVPTGVLWPMEGGSEESISNTLSNWVKIRGGVMPTELRSGFAIGQDATNAYKPFLLGPNPSPALANLHDAAEKAILGACGVPTSTLGQSDGTLAREAFRQFLAVTLQPVAKVVAQELSIGLETQIDFNFGELAAADVASKARALNSLVQAGLTVEDAKAAVGLQ